MSCASKPLKVANTALGDKVLDDTHALNKLFLDLRFTDNVVGGDEVLRYSYEGILGPAGEPVHCAATEQPRKLERSTSKFFSDLVGKTNIICHSNILYAWA